MHAHAHAHAHACRSAHTRRRWTCSSPSPPSTAWSKRLWSRSAATQVGAGSLTLGLGPPYTCHGPLQPAAPHTHPTPTCLAPHTGVARIRPDALEALQEAAEAFVVGVLRLCWVCFVGLSSVLRSLFSALEGGTS